jgi:hypothetical protein
MVRGGYLPLESKVIRDLLYEVHDTTSGGHGGMSKTYQKLNVHFCWSVMKGCVCGYVQQCVICQSNKYEAINPLGLLQPLPILEQIWQDIYELHGSLALV